MYGSGAVTGMDSIRAARKPIRRVLHQVSIVSLVVAAGSTVPGVCAVPFAATIALWNPTIILVSAFAGSHKIILL